MPIKGMSNQRAEFPEIGQLRKGGEKQVRKDQNGEEYTIWGKDLDHFRFTSEIPEVEAAFAAVYDGQPRMINIMLPFRSVDENLDAWQEEYTASSLVHRCDGETMVLWLKDDGTYSTEPKPCPYATGQKKRTGKQGCKPTARLKVIIPELHRLAYVTVLTNSNHDIRNLDGQLRAIESLRGDLRGIPLQLRRSLKTISTPDDKNPGKRVRRPKWLLSIEAAPNWVSLQLAAQEAAALPQLPATTGGIVVDGTTGEIMGSDWDEELFDAGEDEPMPGEPGPIEPPPEPEHEDYSPTIHRPGDLYDAVKPLDYYHSIPHMLNTLRKLDGDDKLNWPASDPQWYDQALDKLTEYARANQAQDAIKELAGPKEMPL